MALPTEVLFYLDRDGCHRARVSRTGAPDEVLGPRGRLLDLLGEVGLRVGGPAEALPHKAFEIRVSVSAHRWEDVADEVERIADHLREHGPICNSVAGGHVSHTVEVRHDPAMTIERNHAELEAWATARSEARRAEAVTP